jgi:hypothetical protein
MTNRTALVCGVAVGAALYSLYALFILDFLLRVDISRLDAVQSIVVIAMIARFLAVMVVFAVKRTVPIAMLLLFAADFLFTLVVAGAYLLFLVPALPVLARSVDAAAIAAFLAFLPACLIFLSAVEMARSQRIASVLLSVLLEIGLLYLMIGYVSQAQGSIQFNDFPALMVLAAKADIANGTIPPISVSFAILPLAAIYSSLLIYAGLPGVDRSVPTRMRLAIPLLSTLVTLGGLFFTSFFLRAALVLLPTRIVVAAVPLLVSLAAIWLLSRRAASRRPTLVARKVLPVSGKAPARETPTGISADD